MLVKVKEILGNNSELITNTLNSCFAMYRDIIQVPRNLESYVRLIAKKMEIKFKVYKEFESLYDLDTSRDMFIDMVYEMFPEFITNAIVNGLMMNENWLNFDKLGGVKGNNETIQNYSGFAITNQQGQFTKNSGTMEQSGGMSKLQYISFLQTYIDEKISKFLNKFKSNVLKLIY